MLLSLVIVTRQRAQQLRSTLASLARCEPGPAELIVVDGDAARSAEPVVREHTSGSRSTRVRYVNGPPGLTVQRNIGLDLATGDVVVFADDDVSFDRDLFAALAAAYADPAVVGVTARLTEPEQRRIGTARTPLRRLLLGRQGTMTAFGYPRRIVETDRPHDVEFMHGCLMSARRDAALALRFDERMPGYALAEDEDFGYRLSKRGRVVYDPRVHIVHHVEGRRSMDRRAFNARLVVNRAYLLRKNFAPAAGAWAGFGAMLVLLLLHRAANRDWAGMRGLVDGTREAWATRPPRAPVARTR